MGPRQTLECHDATRPAPDAPVRPAFLTLDPARAFFLRCARGHSRRRASRGHTG
ncbi:Hypothetical protein AA314_02063 [Archangium gephyra]|uniref:Uncharacterized protein n=1 Tax=Archangium gephyra TaxID=48 RepID=A0AAC8TBZ8_9BACT|nr:Hypothetical protein AA314_02063 [Archangium gephyra]